MFKKGPTRCGTFLPEVLEIARKEEKELLDKVETQRKNPSFLKNIQRLTTEELIELVCDLDAEEKRFPGWGLGSTSMVPKVLKILEKRTNKEPQYKKDLDSLTNLFFENRINPYIPLGLYVSLEIKSKKDYLDSIS